MCFFQHQHDLEISLFSTSAKLQETLNELNTVKSQLHHAEEKLNERDGGSRYARLVLPVCNCQP